jgi:hypothetical protein
VCKVPSFDRVFGARYNCGMLNANGAASMWDIAFVNSAVPSVQYHDWDIVENPEDALTVRFETSNADMLRGCICEDIGGLQVYVRGDAVVAVYDYENFVGWLV